MEGGVTRRRLPAVLTPIRALRHPLGVRFSRYFLGSLVAVVTSETAFVLCYGSGLLGTTGSSAVAFVAGAIPNYILNRWWAWGRRGRPRVGREIIVYAGISIVSLVAAALATGWAGRWAPHVAATRAERTTIVAAAYLATYGALFVLKFLAFELVVFPGSSATTT
jgi:putative flippase GtrA